MFAKRLLLTLLATVSLFLAASSARAEYVFSNGYWWSGGAAYTRSSVVAYDHRGCKYYRYQYAKANVISSQTEGWRAKLLELKANREKWQAGIQASANEHNEFIEALRELGLDGNYYQTSIGVAAIDRSHPYAIQGGYSGQAYTQLAAPQGATLYGYVPSSFTVADVYGNVDLGGLYNAAIRLASDSNSYGSKATSGAMTLVDQLGDRAASLMDRAIAVEETRAKAAGIAQVSQSLSQAIKAEARAYVATAHGGSGQPPEPDGEKQAAIQNGTLSTIADVLTYRCVRCHKPGGKAEQFDLSNLDAIGPEDAANVLARVTTNDPAKRMPPEPDKPLSLHELRVVFAAAGTQQPAKQD